MDEKRTLWKAVSSARRSLFFEHVLIGIQKGLLYAVLSSTLVYFASRFFVFPYYSYVAFIVAIVLFLGQLIWTIWKGPSRKKALFVLDSFYPHNELVTVLTAKNQTALISQLLNRSVTLITDVLRMFKKRPKNIWQQKVMLSCFVSFIIFIILLMFPADTQKEAKIIEEEQEITEDLKEKIEEQKVDPLPEEVQKKLDELLQAIEEAKTSDEIVKELVKAQKELTKMEQQLASQEQNEQIKSQLAAIQSVTSSLAENTNKAMKQLSEIGKPLDFTMQRTIANMNQNMSNITASNGSNNSNQQSGNSSNQQNNNSNQQSGNSNSQGQTQGQGTPQGEGTGQSQGVGQGQGQGQGAGQGEGQGLGQGQGGEGQTGGLQGGFGSGGRELIAVPERIGQAGDSTVDSGTINDGETITEKGPVNTTKGTVRAYGDVIGSYKESYRKSTDRLQLPSDLQKMVQSYFTAIE